MLLNITPLAFADLQHPPPPQRNVFRWGWVQVGGSGGGFRWMGDQAGGGLMWGSWEYVGSGGGGM